jgi:hypothetical protein
MYNDVIDELILEYSPFKYYVLDLTGRHTGNRKALGDKYHEIQMDFKQRITYQRHVVTLQEKNILKGLVSN